MVFPRGLSIEIVERREDAVELALGVDASQLNGAGVIHGGAVFTLLDTAVGFLIAKGLGPGESCVSVSSTITHVAPVRADDRLVRARATVAHRGRTIVHAEARAHSDGGRLVAQGLFVFYVRAARPS